MDLNKIKEQLDFYENKGKSIGLNVSDYNNIKNLLNYVTENYSKSNLEIIYINQLLCILYNNGVACHVSDEIIDYLKQNTSLLPLALANNKKSKVNLIFDDCIMFLCPFHNDRRPSFRILDYKNFGHCLGCNKGVDAITYLRDYEQIKYAHAVELLASIYMIEISSMTQKYELVEKYQNQILSDKYQQLLENVFYRLVNKYGINNELLNTYQERFETINRIKNNRFDTSISNIPFKKNYILTSKDLGDLNDIKKKIKF